MTEATFTANKLEDALALVKRAFGADAVIVSSRRISGDTPRFEVTASAGEGFEMLALPRPPTRTRSSTKPSSPKNGRRPSMAPRSGGVTKSESGSRSASEQSADNASDEGLESGAPVTETRRTVVENELDEAYPPVIRTAKARTPSYDDSERNSPSSLPPSHGDSKLESKSSRSKDVAGLEKLTLQERPLPSERPSSIAERSGERHQNMLERLLVRNELPPELIREFLARSPRTARSLSEAQADLEATLAASLTYQARSDDYPRITALVGPTGVGKTTTIAKLAARDALIERKRVVLVSTDNYRIAGAEQLEQYANLIGIPCEIACDGPSLASILVRHSKADRVFIDTAGRAPRDRDAICDMAEMLSSPGWPVEIHLCLAAAMRSAELKYALAQHEPLNPNALLITKLDEAIAFGGILSAAIWSRLPLSYFTTGQRVPEDLELATSMRLAGALAGDEVES